MIRRRKPVFVIKCKKCRKEFLQNRSNQKFCSSRCNHIFSGLKCKYFYRSQKKPFCNLCGFIAVDKCQLDLDHIDGNHSNNNSSNLQTLCANCHRLKTRKNKEGIFKSVAFEIVDKNVCELN